MCAIHVSVRVAPVRRAFSHGDHTELRLSKFLIIIIIIKFILLELES